MSSFLSKASQKCKEYFGASITKDENLEQNKAFINDHDQFFRMLFQSYQAMSLLFQGNGSQQNNIMKELQKHFYQISIIIGKFYEKESDANKRIGIELSSLFNNASKLFESKVQPTNEVNNQLNGWLKTIEELKVQMQIYHEQRLIYDHYNQKLIKLRSDRQILQAQRKIEPAKFTEQLQRNELKFNSSSDKYAKTTQEIIVKMNSIIIARHSMVNGSVEEFLDIINDLFKNLSAFIGAGIGKTKKFKYSEINEPEFVKKTKEIINQNLSNINSSIQQPQVSDFKMTQSLQMPSQNNEIDDVRLQYLNDLRQQRSSVQSQPTRMNQQFSQQNQSILPQYTSQQIIPDQPFSQNYQYNQNYQMQSFHNPYRYSQQMQEMNYYYMIKPELKLKK